MQLHLCIQMKFWMERHYHRDLDQSVHVSGRKLEHMEKIRKGFSEYTNLKNLNNSFLLKPENSVEEQEKMIRYSEEFFLETQHST